MKPALNAVPYIVIVCLGLIWAAGCSTGTSGGQTVTYYTMDLSMKSGTLQNGGKDTVNCFIRDPDGYIYVGGILKFSTLSENPAQSNITTQATSDTTSTGTDIPVIYNPIAVDDTFDVIYAAFVTNTEGDTIILDSTIVTIIQP